MPTTSSSDSLETAPFAPLAPAPRPENEPDNEISPGHELDYNPRYLVLNNFHSRFLPDDRDIEVYLPEAYLSEPTRRFPVFFLHDGQNLFDSRTSYVPDCTWRAHTTADRLTREGIIEPVILVGINNTGVRRMAEYTPSRDLRLRGGDGDLYGRLLVEELKPLIDRTFRTLPGAPHTAIGGSSLGGLISLYLAFTYPTSSPKSPHSRPASGGTTAPSSAPSLPAAPAPTSASGSTWAPPKASATSATPTSSTAGCSTAAGATRSTSATSASPTACTAKPPGPPASTRSSASSSLPILTRR